MMNSCGTLIFCVLWVFDLPTFSMSVHFLRSRDFIKRKEFMSVAGLTNA